MTSSKKIFTALAWFGVLSVTVALVAYAYLGTFTRYMGDDYCLLADLRYGNILANAWSKYLFRSNRFSNLFVLGFWELFPKSIAFVPALHIALWTFGLYRLLSEADQTFDWKLETPIRLFAAEATILFSFFTASNVFQVLYWRPGQVTYLTPLVLFTLLLAPLIRLARNQRSSLALAALFAFSAFFIGGLSETVGVFHVSFLALAVAGVYFFDASPRRTPALTLLSALLAGAVLAVLVMFLSPANDKRINDENGAPSMIAVIFRAAEFALFFLRNNAATQPLPFAGLLGIFGLLSYLFFLDREKKRFDPRFFWVFLLIPALLYALVFASFAPSAYGQSYPLERVRFPAHYLIILALAAFGMCAGYALSFVKLPAFTRQVAAGLTFIALLYPFWMTRQPLATYEIRSTFALRWDEREQMIRELKAKGEREVFVPGLGGYEGTKELDAHSSYWVNVCAARAYDIDSITAFAVEDEYILEFFSR